jgi:hypothetical protein
VSLGRFQSELMRLIVDPTFREDAVASISTFASDPQLTPREQRRLAAVARSDGLGITVLLHRGWRLGKLLSLMPATCALLGPDRLAAELGTFWRDRLPDSLYFHEEALAFADHLAREKELFNQIPTLEGVLAHERGRLETRRAPLTVAGSH